MVNRGLRIRASLHRLGRMHERFLAAAGRLGLAGTLLTTLAHSVATQSAWLLVTMGVSLFLWGAAFALVGEEVSLRAYSDGESDQMPAIGKQLSGLLASAGGIAICFAGASHMLMA